MTKASYWEDRFRGLGHTGWADPVIYCYDQPERLAIVKAALLMWSVNCGEALDFGCGTGDFSKLLLRLGYKVCGYDPYVQPQISARGFAYAPSYEDISIKEHGATLVLSVTTLDHILEDDAFLHAINLISRLLHETGVFILLEYALDSAADRRRFGGGNSYQSLRTLADWVGAFDRAGLTVSKVIPAPHPVLNPTLGYLAYTRVPIVRLRRACTRVPVVRSWFNPLLKRAAEKTIRGFPPKMGSSAASPLKLICCVRKETLDEQPERHLAHRNGG
jgi:SAM-dependent methyltransferase